MKRGEIWTVAGGKDYTGKPRPAAIVQDDRFDGTKSITICPFTANPAEAPLFRLIVQPDVENGLRAGCRLMVDKITCVQKSKLREKIGRLADHDVLRLNRAILVFLGIAAPANKSLITRRTLTMRAALLHSHLLRCDNDSHAGLRVPVPLWTHFSAAIRT